MGVYIISQEVPACMLSLHLLGSFCSVPGMGVFSFLLKGRQKSFGASFIRASPAVWQIELPSLIFSKNVKNTPPTVWQKTWQFLATWEKPASSA